MDVFRLDGMCAFVTGAGRGIGQQIAVTLAERGADVGCFDLPDSEGLPETASRIAAQGRKAVEVRGDVRSSPELAAAVAQVEKELGPLAAAVNCAGIAESIAAEEMEESQWRRMIDINLTGVFLSCQAEAHVMLPRGQGAIVNIASMSGSIVNRGLVQTHYNTAKAAVAHLTKSLAMEWCDRGVRVNSISPGYTATAMVRRPEIADQVKGFETDTPLGRLASVDEIAWPTAFLCSPAASYCTGHDLVVDGGFTCW